MGEPRAQCLQCLHLEALATPVADHIQHGTECHRSVNRPCIFVSDPGVLNRSRLMFNRLRPPRAHSVVRTRPFPLAREQFMAWRTPTWRHVRSDRSLDKDSEVYLLVEWEDVKRLCSFEVVARATPNPTEGRGNARVTSRGTFGIIVPPVVLIHRCASLAFISLPIVCSCNMCPCDTSAHNFAPNIDWCSLCSVICL